MRTALSIAILCLSAVQASANERDVFYGTWGTAKQCAGEPLKPGGTVLAEPFSITPEWLKQGRLWCRLSWLPIEPRGDGFFTVAQAQCGEDSVRDYSLRFELSSGKLTLRWGFLLSNGPLAPCPKS